MTTKIGTMLSFAAAILAAGRGTRMKSAVPKVLLPLAGRPMIHYIVETLQRLPFAEIVVVVGHQAKAVQEAVEQVAGEQVRFVVQDPPRGTGDAIRLVSRALSPGHAALLAVNGDDAAFYRESTIRRLLDLHVARGSIITNLFARRDPDVPFGRVRVDEAGEIEFMSHEAMLERGLRLNLVSTGAYVFDVPWLAAHVEAIPLYPNGEYPIFELVYVAQREGRPAGFMLLDDDWEWMSVNTPEEYRLADERMRALARSGEDSEG